ncbi:YgjV family protein [Azospirillum sp. YIM B02556]|uniref:YgjV family protein n=1 Tax=Azospirillum endophyticum TaxID=2800326 RepID=A0ABS1F8T3_9PROT|nr:YgjV family protein [Azospirillum endophyticum]MBK1839840.1 YgjV family protein [Azospirillum endophyticum]
MSEFLTDLLPLAGAGGWSAAQLFGFCGTLGGMLWPFFRSRTGMLLVQLVPCLCFALHFAMVGAPTGAALNALAALQVLAALAIGTRPAFRIVYLLILPVIAAVMAVTWAGLPSAFAAAGMALISLARYQTRVALFRGTMLVALPCWFVHNSLVGSVPAMISDLTGIAVNAWMLLRGNGPAPASSTVPPTRIPTPMPPAAGEGKPS